MRVSKRILCTILAWTLWNPAAFAVLSEQNKDTLAKGACYGIPAAIVAVANLATLCINVYYGKKIHDAEPIHYCNSGKTPMCCSDNGEAPFSVENANCTLAHTGDFHEIECYDHSQPYCDKSGFAYLPNFDRDQQKDQFERPIILSSVLVGVLDLATAVVVYITYKYYKNAKLKEDELYKAHTINLL